MALCTTIVEQLARIGASVSVASGTAIDVLVHKVEWPDAAFVGSTTRMRDIFRARGRNVDGLSDEAIRDEMPWLRQFRFLPSSSRGAFWDGWESTFSSVDSTKVIPFGSDEAYFYFVTENTQDPGDPRIYKIDHEEVDQEPYDARGLTVSGLLSIIEPVESSK